MTICGSTTVDLVILDMIMPKGKNGRETYEAILNDSSRPERRSLQADMQKQRKWI